MVEAILRPDGTVKRFPDAPADEGAMCFSGCCQNCGACGTDTVMSLGLWLCDTCRYILR